MPRSNHFLLRCRQEMTPYCLTWQFLVMAFACGCMLWESPPVVAATQRTVIDFDTASTNLFLDRWMYPFNATPGSRIQAPTFSAIAEETFDERDGQFLLAINTEAAGIPKGLPASSYSVSHVSWQLTEAVGDYPFDGTIDDFTTHLPAGALATSDTDAGRPIELYGAGMRNGFGEFGWPDGSTSTAAPVFSAASSWGVMGKGTRNVFASDALGVDVSNSFDSLHDGINGYNTQPLAIGQASQDGATLSAGSLVSAGASYQFNVDLDDPAILSYIQRGLSQGQLGFVVTSMHSTGELGQGAAYPNLATANHFAFAGPKFEMDWDVVATTEGDFNKDGQLTSQDIDLLSLKIRRSDFDAAMDLNRNQQLDSADREIWVAQLAHTTFGDANLDRVFSSLDLIHVFQTGQYEDSAPGNSGWNEGDWNGDGEFSSADFLVAFQSGSYEKATSATTALPEPGGSLTLIGMVSVIAWQRHFRPRRISKVNLGV